jgi:hypothetical protein
VQFDPAVHKSATLGAGDVLEFELTDPTKPVHIVGSRPILVALYMQGHAAIPGNMSLGDPSMSVAVPTEQFRSDYLFTAPATYAINFAEVIAKPDAQVRVDGELIAEGDYTPIGESGYGVARKSLSPNSSVHTLKADQEVGLNVYGYGQYTSYMYPGGADLERITIPDIL